jgi:hypothetical protein
MQKGNPKAHQDVGIKYTALAAALATVLLFIFSEPLFNMAAQALLKIN